MRMKARPVSFGFSLLFQLQDTRSYRVEGLFGRLAKQRILMLGQGRSDFCPILRLQSLEGGRKEIAIFHHDVIPLVLDEIANDVIHILPRDFTIRENTLDRFSDAAQTLSPFLMLKCEVTDFCGRSREVLAWQRPGLPGDDGTSPDKVRNS